MSRRHPLAKCEDCPLNVDGVAFVPSKIPDEVQLSVVGEAPGFQEAMYGRPFAGPSGKLIKKVLSHHNFDVREVAFTNACLCRPADNETPPKDAIAACRPRLVDELKLAAERGGRDVLALGSTAAGVLIDDPRKITTLRVGAPKPPSSILNGSGVERVVPTWHPAYCLRTGDAFPSMVRDVGKLVEDTRPPWQEPDIRVFDDSIEDALEAIAVLQETANVLVIDIEVGIDKDESFDHPNEYEMLCIGVAHAKGKAIVFGSSVLEHIVDKLKKLFSTKKLVAHNGKFDLSGLYPIFGDLPLYFDTMLAHYVLDERSGGHGLKVLAVEELGAPAYDDEIKQYIPKRGNYANIPRPILYHYNGLDVACTWDLYELFSARLDRPVRNWPYADREVKTLRDVHDFLVAAAGQLKFLELNGITLDYAYNDQLREMFNERLEGIEKEIDEIVTSATKGEKTFLNPRSPKQIKEFLAEVKINVEATDVDTLTPLSEALVPTSYGGMFISTLLRHRRQQKLVSTYVVGLRKRAYRGRIYTTYTLHGTTSGRLASKNPNLQNIDRDKIIRRQFVVSKPEYTFIQADYKQAEGRVICTLAQDEYLRSIFADPDQDLFNALGSQLYKCPVEQLDKEMRIRTKAFFYGLGYGREARSIATEFKIPLREAESLMNDFMALIPATAAWQKSVKETVLSGKDLITPFGRHRRFHLITKQNQHSVLNEALSYLPQSTSSDICLSAAIELRPRLRGLGWMRLTIHDALVVECPTKFQDEVSEMLRECMVRKGRQFTEYVPFAVDLSYGRSWGDL